MTYKPQSKKVGKPVGTRSIPTLHAEILRVLKEDKEQNGEGLTASGISKALATPDPTVRLYLGDLEKDGKVSCRRIVNMNLYQIIEMPELEWMRKREV